MRNPRRLAIHVANATPRRLLSEAEREERAGMAIVAALVIAVWAGLA